MRKIICFALILVLSLTFLTGCDASPKDVNKLLKTMEKQKIVDKKVQLVDTVYCRSSGLFPSSTQYYIYKSDSGLIAIHYERIISKNYKYTFMVTIYNNVTLNNGTVEYVEDASTHSFYCIYQDGTISIQNKYVFNDENKTEYKVYEGIGLFSKRYIFK